MCMGPRLVLLYFSNGNSSDTDNSSLPGVLQDIILFCSYRQLVSWALFLSPSYRWGNLRFRKTMPGSWEAGPGFGPRLSDLKTCVLDSSLQLWVLKVRWNNVTLLFSLYIKMHTHGIYYFNDRMSSPWKLFLPPLLFKRNLDFCCCCFWPCSVARVISVPWLGIKPINPLQWKCGVLTTRPPIQFSHSVVSNSLQPHGLQHARHPCPDHQGIS